MRRHATDGRGVSMMDHRNDLPESKRRGPAYGAWLVLIYLALVPLAVYFLVSNLP
jgi:hypothetical protein